MSRITHASAHQAITALQLLTGWAGGWTPYERRSESCVKVFWRPAMAQGLPKAVRRLDERYEGEIVMGLPETKRFNQGVGQATVLWVRIETGEQYERAKQFRPLPTMVLREGASLRRLLIWGLEQPLSYTHCYAANRRLAYHMGCRQSAGEPDGLAVHMPGTSLRIGKKRPVPIVCARLGTETFLRDQVVGDLVDPPELKPWWERKAIGGSTG